ncbi:MAG: type 2 lanthipeptide synthetase LanM family protein [Thermosynechococcaceae cyanobacterium]
MSMGLSPDDLRQIVAQSQFLWERAIPPESSMSAPDAVEAQLRDWCQQLADGDWAKFQQRLGWDGWTADGLRAMLHGNEIVSAPSLPDWAEWLGQISQGAALRSSPGAWTNANATAPFDLNTLPPPFDPNEPLPFEELLWPAVWTGRMQLRQGLHQSAPTLACDPFAHLSPQAYGGLERSLLKQLSYLSGKTLMAEFSQFRPQRYQILNRWLGSAENSAASCESYVAFCQTHLADGYRTLWLTYPVWGRLLATGVQFWVASTVEFVQRLMADWAVIAHTFLPLAPTELGSVVHMATALSDPHHQGRTVGMLTFASGLRLVYKPKNLALDKGFQDLLRWCNQHPLPCSFQPLVILERDRYGWVEAVSQTPCPDADAAHRFYQRAGMLLGLLYVLGATDCHLENLIAHGEHPVLIDLETLLQPEARSGEGGETPPRRAIDAHLWDSVLRTGLLPRWELSPDRQMAFDISGLGSVEPQTIPRKATQWTAINTDAMHLSFATVTRPIQQNVPFLLDTPLSPNDYLADLTEGFAALYRLLLDQSEAFLTDSPLQQLQTQSVRFVFRVTDVYAALLRKILSPDYLKNGLAFSIQIDALSRAALVAEGEVVPRIWPMIRAEQRAIAQQDIPYFTVSAQDDALTLPDGTHIPHFFVASGYQDTLNRVQSLSLPHLQQQLAILQGTFYARVARSPIPAQSPSPPSTPQNMDGPPLTPETFLAEALRLAAEIETQAIDDAQGHPNWIGMHYIPAADRFQFEPLDDSLYHGRTGIALFLAALYRITPNESLRHMSLGAVTPLIQHLTESNADLRYRLTREWGIGGALGLGSFVYALTTMAHWLGEADPAASTLLGAAHAAADWITPEAIAGDRHLDITSGTAGAILGLCRLHRLAPQADLLEKLHLCGQHLLHTQRVLGSDLRAWQTVAKTPLTGFSHGAAGIAYALVQVFALTQEAAYLEAAQAGMVYEQHQFDATAQNWLDLRFTPPTCMCGWCHGAPGIGLARIGCLPHLTSNALDQDIEIALATTQTASLTDVDHLCCGNMGRIDVLLTAAQWLQRPDLAATAHARATQVVASATARHAYRLFANLPTHVYNPSLFQGTAGIGYALLRLATPTELPSLLLWE